MANKELQEELNRINELYHEYDLKLRKNGASMEERQQLRDMMNAKKAKVTAELGDDLAKLNAGKASTITGANPAIKKGGKMVLKKPAGIIPLAGVGMAAMESPAASASELIQDPNVQRAALSELAGPVGDVIDIGASAAEFGLDKYLDEKEANVQYATEVQARRDYEKSPASRDAAAARGEPDPLYNRKPIGGDKFQQLTGAKPKKPEPTDEESKKKLAKLRALTGVE